MLLETFAEDVAIPDFHGSSKESRKKHACVYKKTNNQRKNYLGVSWLSQNKNASEKQLRQK